MGFALLGLFDVRDQLRKKRVKVIAERGLMLLEDGQRTRSIEGPVEATADAAQDVDAGGVGERCVA